MSPCPYPATITLPNLSKLLSLCIFSFLTEPSQLGLCYNIALQILFTIHIDSTAACKENEFDFIGYVRLPSISRGIQLYGR